MNRRAGRQPAAASREPRPGPVPFRSTRPVATGAQVDNTRLDPRPVQISSPATAKNIIAVGASMSDRFTAFGAPMRWGERLLHGRAARPRRIARMAPMLTGPGSDLLTGRSGRCDGLRSRDNGPTICRSGRAARRGKLRHLVLVGLRHRSRGAVRDYFAAGVYPTGSRAPPTVRRISRRPGQGRPGRLRRFNEGGRGSSLKRLPEHAEHARLRCRSIGGPPSASWPTPSRGYGRPVLTNVLPLANWSATSSCTRLRRPKEYPAAPSGLGQPARPGAADRQHGILSTLLASPRPTRHAGCRGPAAAAAHLRIAPRGSTCPLPHGRRR